MPPKVELKPNYKRIVEAILFLIEEAAKDNYELTQFEIVKSIFIADLFHLKKYGRPVSFDNYAAMPFGPVPSATYDMLKPNYAGNRHFGDDWPLWDRVPFPERAPNAAKFINIRRGANRRRLSQTDMNELQDALKFVRVEGFQGIKDWTHMLESYTTAWNARGGMRSSPMDYRLLDESLNEEVIANIAHASHFLK